MLSKSFEELRKSHDRMSEQIARMQVILEKLDTGSFETKGKEKVTVNGSSNKGAKLEECLENVEVQEAVIKVEEAPLKSSKV